MAGTSDVPSLRPILIALRQARSKPVHYFFPRLLCCRAWRLELAQSLDPSELASTQLRAIGRIPTLRRLLLEENARFSSPRIYQWFESGCLCSSADEHESDSEDLFQGNAEEPLDGTIVRVGRDVELLDPRQDYLGYKIVHFCRHPDGRGAFDGVWAVLHLQLPGRTARIYTSEGHARGSIVRVIPPHHGLNAKQKYNTNHCFVTGVQFFGAPAPTKAALLAFQRNRGFLVSGFGGANKMRYELGREHWEPRAGQTRNGYTCTEGLHFFVDAASAFNYGTQASSNTSFLGLVTLRLSKARGLVYAIEDGSESEATQINFQSHGKIHSHAKPISVLNDPTSMADMQKFLLDMVEAEKRKYAARHTSLRRKKQRK